jgi:hypothetical protein
VSETRDIAEHAASLCAGALALVLPAGAAQFMPLAVPIVGLAAIGLALRNSSVKRAGDRAVAETLAAMERAGEFAPEDVATALSLLKDEARTISIVPAEFPAAALTGDLNGALAKKLVAPLAPEGDPVARVLEVAFRASVAILRSDPAFHRGLTQELLIDAARANGVQLRLLVSLGGKFDDVNRKLDGLSNFDGLIDDLRRASRDQMEALANRFGIAAIYDLSDAALRDALEKKAEEYRAYRAADEALGARILELAKLRTAAQDAAARLDFEEVEAWLARVDELQTEIAAEAKRLRAENALLRGRTEDGFHFFAAAADTLATLDPTEAAARRVDFAHRLQTHSVRYGGTGSVYAEQTLNCALEVLSEVNTPMLWAMAQFGLANACQTQGARSSGPKSEIILDRSVSASDLSLRVLTKSTHPEAWAAVRSARANSLLIIGRNRPDQSGVALLLEAICDYRSCLIVSKHPRMRATAYSNIANVLQHLGEIAPEPDKATYLSRSLRAANAVFRYTDGKEFEELRAITKTNQGVALGLLARHAVDEIDYREHLTAAIKAYDDALQFFREETYPIEWARANANLGIAHEDIARGLTLPEARLHLRKSEEHLGKALTAFRQDHLADRRRNGVSQDLARVRRQLAEIEEMLS